MPSIGLIIFFVILFIITIGLTLYAFKLEEKKMNKYEQEGDTVKDELKRSHEYESRSIKTSIAVQVLLYFILVAIFVIGLVIYVKISL